MSASRLTAIGVIVLVLGLSAAVFLYRQARLATSNPTGEWRDSTLPLTDSKANTRDIEMYGGKLEVLMVNTLAWFHRPESQALVIATTSGLIALACFLIAHHPVSRR